MPRASVIVCVYNRERQIVSCIDSLLAMRYRDFELVAVDDASTDGTVAVLERYAANAGDVEVRVIRNPRNLGVSGARNAGIAAARGEIVAFTDSDCTVDAEWLGALVGAFDDPTVVAAGGRVDDVPPRTYGELVYRGTCRIGRPAQGRFLVGCNMAFRRDVLVDYGFDPALSYYCDEDELSERLAADGLGRRYVEGARVLHDHTMSFRGYLRMSFRHGQGAARFWYKHGRWLGRDVVVLVAALALVPLTPFSVLARWLAVACLALFVAMQCANELLFKRKTLVQLILALPGVMLHSLWKLAGVVVTYVRIARGDEPEIVTSKGSWSSRVRRPAVEEP